MAFGGVIWANRVQAGTVCRRLDKVDRRSLGFTSRFTGEVNSQSNNYLETNPTACRRKYCNAALTRSHASVKYPYRSHQSHLRFSLTLNLDVVAEPGCLVER